MDDQATMVKGWENEVETKWKGQVEEIDRQISAITQIEIKSIVQIKMWKKIIKGFEFVRYNKKLENNIDTKNKVENSQKKEGSKLQQEGEGKGYKERKNNSIESSNSIVAKEDVSSTIAEGSKNSKEIGKEIKKNERGKEDKELTSSLREQENYSRSKPEEEEKVYQEQISSREKANFKSAVDESI
jgi:hypothetical protein